MALAKQGFTLVELVLVIIVLSIVGIATTNYLSTGVNLYSDISERDRELNSVRFAMERLRRDLSNALPNSLVVSDTGNCLTFTPIRASTVYEYDFPIYPLSATSASIATIQDYSFVSGDQAVIYLLDASELSADNVQDISSIDNGNELMTFSSEVSFPLSSPSNRLYIINGNKSYYFSGSELILAEQCSGSGSVMANDISGQFTISEATLQRNGLAKVTFNLDFDGQEVPLEQTLHVNNVP